MTFIELEGLGGLCKGSFFKAPIDSVAAGKPPGMSLPQTPPKPLKGTFFRIMIGKEFCYSPNLSWFLMVAAAWCVFPYNLDEYNSDDKEANVATLLELVKNRLVINHSLALFYISFWHWALYIRGFCERPYVPNRIYNVPKVLHNLFYTVMGILQWTLVEGAFIHLYKSGRLPYVDAMANPSVMLQTLVLSILLPSFRDVHFYFAHRFIHLRPLYKYVHSLHHRNTDIEPFSGLAMHPIEHLYYYTCYHPNLVLPLVGIVISPFLVFWMGAHLVISPACSHSGFEDHFSASTEHYLHHRFCDVNFAAGINFDAYFGTHKTTLPLPDNASESRELPPPPADPKSTLRLLPEHPEYVIGIALMVLWALKSYQTVPPLWVAMVISVGPTLWAVILALATAPKSLSLKKSFLAPFDKDSFGSLALHLGVGFVMGVLPATHLLYVFLQDFN